MFKRLVGASATASVLLICGCSANAVPATEVQSPKALPAKNTAVQYLDVYNTGSPGIYTGEYARYSLPDLKLVEQTAATGVASSVAFGTTDLPYFIDEAPQGNYAVYDQPPKTGTVPAAEQFYGVPCQSPSLSIGPTGKFYATQYCSGNVIEFAAGAQKNKPKKPIATYAGGNLTGGVYPTYSTVDRKGGLYVGDTGGGVTYFAPGSTRAKVVFATGSSQQVSQMIVDSKGNVWSVHYPSPTVTYFANKTNCVPDPSGTIKRVEQAEEFTDGTFDKSLYTSTSDSPVFASDGLSIAVDSSGRVYLGDQNSSDKGVLVDYPPNDACPDDGLSFTLQTRAFPEVAVDSARRLYVSDLEHNTISEYADASKKPAKHITQKVGIITITSMAVGP